MKEERPMDSRLRKRMVKNLLTSPAVAIPLWLGLLVFLISAAAGAPLGLWGLAGLGGMALGAAAAGFRWTAGSEKLKQQAQEDLDREAGKAERARLRRLFRSLRRDEDPRTGRYAKDLERFHERLGQVELAERDVRAGILPEVRRQAGALYQSCVASLQRTLDLWQTAQTMATPDARQQLLDTREQLLDEIGQSIEHLGLTLDRLQVTGARVDADEEQKLAEMREELRMGLEVARRVEGRMQQLEQDLQGERRISRETETP